MTDADALLASVLAAPSDDLPRLIYADYLEDTGEANAVARAEFIRLQCAIAAGNRGVDVLARERFLLNCHGAGWLAPLRQPGEALVGKASHAEFRRGFIERVWMRAGVFLVKADKLFNRAPVQELRVTQANEAELRELVCGPAVGRLDTLDIAGDRVGRQVASVVGRSRTIASVQRLLLRGCGLTDEDALLFADVPFDWPLGQLDVRHNPQLGLLGVTALVQRFGAAVVAT